MKRKLFSAILFGALLATSTSGLTSCKDYDDDITNLQGQIDKLATKDELSAKANELANTISTAQQAANAAANVAQEAKTAANNASTDAKAAADAAKAAADAAKAAQNKADEVDGKLTTAVNNAAQQIQDAVKDLATKQEVADAVKEVKDKYDAQAKELKALSDRLAKVEAKLGLGEGGEDIDLTEIQKELEAIEKDLEAICGAVSTMVTSINLYNNTGSSYWPNGSINPYDMDLVFYQAEENDNVFPANGETGSDKYTFVAGNVKTYGDSVLVRVNPVNAELTKENISLMNSQGKELNDLIEVTSVERYSTENAPLTRAAGNENGLWVIKFKPFDNYDADAFDEAALAENNRSIVYAVAVKNTDKNLDADRRVISEYGLALATRTIGYENNFSVTNYKKWYDGDYCWIDDIHNRYSHCESEPSKITTSIPELSWIDDYEPGTVAVLDGDDKNAVNRPTPAEDDRQDDGLVIAKVGEKIMIHNEGQIKGFYVALDYKYALESGKSELNAWNSYSYDNVTKISRTGEIIEAGKLQEGTDGYIAINDLNDVAGDIIGFRLFAVNIDGTLVDPDGRAFYVSVGTFHEDVELPAQEIAITLDKYLDYFDVNTGAKTGKGISSDYIDVKDAFDVDFDWAGNYTITEDKEGNKPDYYSSYYGTGDYKVEYWKKNDDGTYTSVRYTDAEYMTINLLNPEAFEDNLDYTLTISLQPKLVNDTYYDTRKVKVTFKKTMPTFVPSFSYITQQTKNQIMVPSSSTATTPATALNADYKVGTTAKYGYKDLNNVYLFDANSARFNADKYFSYDIAESIYNADNVKDTKVVTTDYKMYVDGSFVDNTTVHAVSSTYLYQQISKIWDADTETYKAGQKDDDQYRVSKATETPLVYMSWASYNTYNWAKKNDNGFTADYKPSVKWLPAGSATIDLDLTQLSVKNTADAGTFDKKNLSAYLAAEYLKIKANSVKTYVGTQVNPYFKPTSWDNNKITLEQVDQAQAAPAAEKHTEKIEFVLIDCFLNEYTVTLDFEVTRD